MHTAPLPDVDEVNSGGRARRRRRNILVAASLAGVVVVAGGCGALQVGDAETDSEAPSISQPTDPLPPKAFPGGDEPVALEDGTYLIAGSDSALAGYTVTVPDGWTGDSGSDLKKDEDTPQGIGVSPWALDDIGVFEEACRGDLGDPGLAPANVAELVSALRAQKSGPIVSDPVPTTLGGFPATRIDLDYPDRMARAHCRVGTGQLQVWGTYFVFFPNHTASLYVVSVAGQSLLLLVDTADRASGADRAELQSILDSIKFEQVE
jgi:hypothetical protein